MICIIIRIEKSEKIITEYSSIKYCFQYYKEISDSIFSINNLVNTKFNQNYEYFKMFIENLNINFLHIDKKLKNYNLENNNFELKQCNINYNNNILKILKDMNDTYKKEDLNYSDNIKIGVILKKIENIIKKLINRKKITQLKNRLKFNKFIFINLYEYYDKREILVKNLNMYIQLIYKYWEKSKEMNFNKLKTIREKNILLIENLKDIFSEKLIENFNPFIEKLNEFDIDSLIETYYDINKIVDKFETKEEFILKKEIRKKENIESLDDFMFLKKSIEIEIPKLEEYILLCEWNIKIQKGFFGNKHEFEYKILIDIFNNIVFWNCQEKIIEVYDQIKNIDITNLIHKNILKIKIKLGILSSFKNNLIFEDEFIKDGFGKYIKFIKSINN